MTKLFSREGVGVEGECFKWPEQQTASAKAPRQDDGAWGVPGTTKTSVPRRVLGFYSE